MMTETRDEAILHHMLNWCEQADDARRQYQHAKENFMENPVYRNVVFMCIFQVCGLANHLSDPFRAAHPELPWNQIRGMRNLFAHDYGNMDLESIWETACQDIPVIEQFCKRNIAI